ncbi:MAG: hypothetical protein WCC27_04250 [Acidobacteriaceae bacterium]
MQQRLAQGWNTWDAHSVITQVLLPEGLAIHAALKHNTTEGSDAFLQDALIGRLNPGAEQVTPGPHAWDGSYTGLRVSWHEHEWRMQSAHQGSDEEPSRRLVGSGSRVPSDEMRAHDGHARRTGTAVFDCCDGHRQRAALL